MNVEGEVRRCTVRALAHTRASAEAPQPHAPLKDGVNEAEEGCVGACRPRLMRQQYYCLGATQHVQGGRERLNQRLYPDDVCGNHKVRLGDRGSAESAEACSRWCLELYGKATRGVLEELRHGSVTALPCPLQGSSNRAVPRVWPRGGCLRWPQCCPGGEEGVSEWARGLSGHWPSAAAVQLSLGVP